MSLPETRERDCQLDTQLVARVLREQFPEHAPHDVRYLNAGWDHAVYQLNGELIVRYRRLPDVIAEDAPLARWCTEDNARALGRALGALHRVALDGARATGLREIGGRAQLRRPGDARSCRTGSAARAARC